MSGGFFRGTSAEQDTRFSNKQAKLLKTQKFPPELEHPVDMTKVKMDVMKPWIAKRLIELVGFEDEVLINFIYGLLDEKVVNGKTVQISLTGFLERNTVKFMKELWSLLLSAQQNASGVPQQFLDAKEEEARKKKAETDRIANEIQRKKEKEKREKEQEIIKKMDGDVDNGRDNNASLEAQKHQSRASSRRLMDEKEPNERSGSRGRSRRSKSPSSANFSPSPRRRLSRSHSNKSFSNSKSHSDERLRSKSISRSPQSRGRSASSERIERSPPRLSISPRRRHSPRRYLSPPRRRPSHSRRRSISPLRYRSPSPARYRMRSPLRRRSRSPMRRRTRSPIRRRSSSQSRSVSQSPVRRRSPLVRRRSRSPIRRRSRSPIRRRSPVSYRRRSPSPSRHRYRRSPSTPRRRSPSPVRHRSPPSGRKRLVSPVRRRSPSPQVWSSPSAVRRSSPSPVRRISPIGKRSSPAQSPRERIRSHGKYSPTRYSSPSEDVDRPANTLKGSNTSERQSPDSLRSPQRDLRDRVGSRRAVPALPPSPPSPHRSRSVSESPPAARQRSPSEERSRGSYEEYLNRKKDKMIRQESFSPPPKARQEKTRHEISNSSADGVETKYSRNARERKYRSPRKVSPTPDKHKGSVDKVHREDDSSPERLANNRTSELRSRSDGTESRKNVEVIKSERPSGRMDLAKNSDQREFPATRKDTSTSKREKGSSDGEENRAHESRQSLSIVIKGQHHEPESLPKSSRKVEQSDRSGLVDSGSEESDRHRARVKDKRKHNRSEREVVSDDGSSSDSHVEDRKEAKRRRKDEKRLKKEERRRRREERRRRREERRAEKRKLKSTNASSPPSDVEKNNDGHSSDDEYVRKRDTRGRDVEETESEQKKLEIALREKALESLRAKKGIGR